ncbi:hypothetical protein ACJA23_03175 [Mycoplasma corogypsi]|uniref:hypothetical protein n=1 Tax=Mycoplasma corogypsi TaxID=2106 RepID=UPI0038731A65
MSNNHNSSALNETSLFANLNYKLSNRLASGKYLQRKFLSILSLILIAACVGFFIYYIIIYKTYATEDYNFVLNKATFSSENTFGGVIRGEFKFASSYTFISADTPVVKLLLQKTDTAAINAKTVLNLQSGQKLFLFELRDITNKVISGDAATIQKWIANYQSYTPQQITLIGQFINTYLDATLDFVPKTVAIHPIFNGLSSTILSFYMMATILQIIVLYWLFKGTRNGNKIYKWIIFFCVASFILTFFLISLQPGITEFVDGKVRKEVVEVKAGLSITVVEEFPNIVKNPLHISYWGLWITLGLSLVICITSVQAKKRYGYLDNSVVLAQKFVDTKDLVKQIQDILDSYQDHTSNSIERQNLERLALEMDQLEVEFTPKHKTPDTKLSKMAVDFINISHSTKE